jgi:hypothetical protein
LTSGTGDLPGGSSKEPAVGNRAAWFRLKAPETRLETAERMGMLQKISRLFVIKTRWEAFMIIYALALGAVERGSAYLTRFPGWGGKLLFLACTGAVFMAGAKILDCLKFEQAQQASARLADENGSEIDRSSGTKPDLA